MTYHTTEELIGGRSEWAVSPNNFNGLIDSHILANQRISELEAQLAAEKFTSEQLQKTIDSMAATEAKHAAEMSRCLKGMDEANEKLRERLTSRNAQLKAAREAGMALLDALEYCHHCGGQLALDEPLVSHCESCPYDCDDHDEPECTPIYVLHDRLRKALAALDGEAPNA